MADNNLTTKEEFLLNPVEEHNITDAAVASFETNLKHPLKVTVPITPIQDLHGYDHPWPNTTVLSGNCENATKTVGNATIVSEDGTFTLSGSLAQGEALRFQLLEPFTLPSNINKVTVHFNNNISGSTDLFLRFIYDNESNLPVSPLAAVNRVFQLTTGANKMIAAFEFYGNKNVTIDGVVMAPQFILEANICPINGVTSDIIKLTSKNLLDYNKIFETPYSSGDYWSFYRFYLPAGTYTLSTNYGDGTPGTSPFRMCANGNRVESNDIINSTNKKTVTIASGGFVEIGKRLRSGPFVPTIALFRNKTIWLQLERGSAKTAHQDFGMTFPITFTDPSTGDPMTVYGGSLTLNEDGSADVVSQWLGSKMSDLTWTYNSQRVCFESNWINRAAHGAGYITNYCSMYKSIANSGYPTNDLEVNFNSTSANDRSYFRLIDRSCNGDVSTFIAKITEQNGFIIWKLQTVAQKTYHFPNVGQLKAFLGENNVWSDIGNVDVKYLTQHSETGLEYRGDRALELRRRAMMADAPTIHTTVGSEETGGLASFKSYVKAPVKKIEIPFSPKQDLHGMPNPYPAGASVNLIPDGKDTSKGYVSNAYLGSTGIEVSNANFYVSECFNVDPAITYTWTDRGAEENPCIAFYDENYNLLSVIKNNNAVSHTFNPPEGAVYARSSQTTEAYQEQNPTGAAFQLEIGSISTEYRKYSNVCPIEGYDGCEITRTGKNLFDKSKVIRGYYMGSSGKPSESSAFGYALVRVGGLSTVRISGNKAENSATRYIPFDSNGHALITTSAQGKGNKTITLPAGTKTLAVNVYISGTNKDIDTVQVEAGSVASAYENFGATLPLVFNQAGNHSFLPIQEGSGNPSPENVRPIHPGLTFTRDDDSVLSVHGGTLTVNADGTGSLVKTINNRIFNGTEAWEREVATTTYNEMFKFAATDMLYGNNHKTGSFNYLKRLSADSDAYTNGVLCGRFGWQSRYIYVLNAIQYIDVVTDLNSWKEYLESNPLEVVYPLQTPITYTLSVTETNRALEALGLTQHIGPLYGGTITINPDGSADVVAQYGYKRFTSSDPLRVAYNNKAQYVMNDMPELHRLTGLNNKKCMCSAFPKVTGSSVAGVMIGVDPAHNWIIFNNLSEYGIENQTQWNTFIDNNVVAVTYPLATPQTYHFSNLEQLKVWLGENNFWCDISDDITVKYWNRG